MAEMKVPANDFLGLLISHPELKQNDFHWKDSANKILGAACVEEVLKELPAKRVVPPASDTRHQSQRNPGQ